MTVTERVLDAEDKILLAQGARERAEIVDKYDKVCGDFGKIY